MIYALSGASVLLLVGVLFLVKLLRDKTAESADMSRQFNELRASYQKIEYNLQTAEKQIRDLNIKNKTLIDEINNLMDNPLVNSTKIKNRIK